MKFSHVFLEVLAFCLLSPAWGAVEIQTTAPQVNSLGECERMGTIRLQFSDRVSDRANHAPGSSYALIRLDLGDSVQLVQIGDSDPEDISPLNYIPIEVEKEQGHPVSKGPDPGSLRIVRAGPHSVDLLIAWNMDPPPKSVDRARRISFTLTVAAEEFCPALADGPVFLAPAVGGKADAVLTCRIFDPSALRGPEGWRVQSQAYWSDSSGTALREYPIPPASVSREGTMKVDAISPAERAALIALYNSTGGPNWTNHTNWLGPEGTEGSWFGVTLDPYEEFVTEISLPNNHLVGQLPVELQNFSWLGYLDLSHNLLNGTIPPFTLQSIDEGATQLDLSNNTLSGTIPNELTFVHYLNLANNQLNGILPPFGDYEFFPIELNLSGNHLNGSLLDPNGTDSPLFSSNYVTHYINLGSNDFTGNLPSCYYCVWLQTLILNYNQLEGPISEEFGIGSDALLELDLSHNLLTGELPSGFGGFSESLTYLNLSNNQFTGTVEWLPGSLLYINLSNNQFTGSLPPGGDCEWQDIWLNSNQFSGSIPPDWAWLDLHHLSLASNQLTGTVEWLPGSLQYINLSNNQFTGSLPPGGESEWQDIWLNSNQFSGSIPPDWAGLDLHHLSLASNQLSGPIPPEFSTLPTNLEYLDLSGNQLSGSIPAFVSGNPSPVLQELYLNDNQFTGSLPETIFTGFPALQKLHFSKNRLTGNLPAVVGNATSLQELHLYGNALGGEIPSTITNLTHLHSASGADDSGLRLDYNGLYTADSSLRSFINSRQYGGDFEATQTVPPTNPAGSAAGPHTVQLSWTPIRYTGDSGRYEVYQRTSGGQFHLAGSTASKAAASFTVEYLQEDRLYYFRLRTVTDPHVQNDNTLTSDLSAIVSVRTPAAPAISLTPGSLSVQCAAGQTVSDQSFTIQNTGGGTLDWTCAVDAGWLQCTPTSGIVTTDTQTVTVSFQTGGLGAGSYSATITVSCPAAANSPQTLPVSLVVTDRNIRVWYNAGQAGRVFADTPSQAIPATYLTFQLDPTAFPDASAANPALLRIQLPAGTALSQTLATGTPATTAPLPSAGEQVLDLAVSEYVQGSGLATMPAEDRHQDAPAIDPHAVQLFHYVTGETAIWLRINESTAGWSASSLDRFLGVTIGVGAAVWPNSPMNNWGEAGLYSQMATLFYLDLEGYTFSEPDYGMPVTFSAFFQTGGTSIPAVFAPAQVSLMKWTGYFEEGSPHMSNLGSELVDTATIDLNRDGLEDVLGISNHFRRLYWVYNQGNSVFDGLAWLDLPFAPVTMTAGDVDGDGQADVILSDDLGGLWLYPSSMLVGGSAKPPQTAPLAIRGLPLPGIPSDALLFDLDGDGKLDYLFTDAVANKLYVLFGDSFNTSSEFATGLGPVGLSVGDFDGDGHFDVAAVNSQGGSVTVLWGDGTTLTDSQEIQSVGTSLVGLDTADLNRDGHTDLVVASAGNKKLVAIPALANRQFSADRQTIYFENTPSAVSADNYDGLYGPDALVGFSDSRKMALCTTDENGHLTHSYSIDPFGDLQVDPEGNMVLAASSILSVGGGTGYGGCSSRQGVAGIQQTTVNVLHFPRSRELSFSVVNLDEQESLVNLELVNDQGSLVTSTTAAVPSHMQYARYVDALLGPEANAAGRWVRGFSTRSDTYGLWLVNDPALTYLDGTRLVDVRQGALDFIFPVLDVGEGHDTTFSLINSTKNQASVVLRRYDANGQQLGHQRIVINGYGRAEVSASALFPGLQSSDSIRVESDRALVAMAWFGTESAMAVLEGIREDAGTFTLYCPHMAVGAIGGVEYRSMLALVNVGGAAAAAQLALHTDGGEQIEAPQPIHLPAQGKVWVDLAELFSLTEPTSGYLRIQGAAGDRLVGCITFEEAATGRFRSCLPLQREGSAKFLLGHIANGTLNSIPFFTGLSVLNAGMTTRTVTVSAYDQYGVLQDSKSLTIFGGRRQVFLLDQLMPGLTAIFGGYILVEGPPESDLMVFELFGDQSLNFLSAVPAVPVD